MTAEVCRCRARVAPDCQDDSYVYEDGLQDDSTYRHGTVVCDACYLLVEAFMVMNSRDIPQAADDAVQRYLRQRSGVSE